MRIRLSAYVCRRLKSLVQSGIPETSFHREVVSGEFLALGTWAPFLLFVTVLVVAAGEWDYAGQRSAAAFPDGSVVGDLSTMPGVSGLAWVGADTFLTVHDTNTRPRLLLPESVSSGALPKTTNRPGPRLTCGGRGRKDPAAIWRALHASPARGNFSSSKAVQVENPSLTFI